MDRLPLLTLAALLLAGGDRTPVAQAQTGPPRSDSMSGSLASAMPASHGMRPTSPQLHYAGYQDPEPADGGPEDTYDVFYDHLSDDGRWYYDDNYGYVFQPAVAVNASDWRPYADGHWVWTDRGWCWVSNEHFGWACYHYGRWIRAVGVGWVWVPGTVWAPAWVSWRQSDDYVGWAPLPPECDDSPSVHISTWCDRYYDIGPAAFCFVAFRDWGRPSYRSYIAPVQNNVTIINRTTNITNIVYNNRVVNNFGPQVQVVSQRLGQPIPERRLTYLAGAQNQRAFATTVQGNQLQVVAPPAQLRRTASVQPAVQNRLGRAQVERGWQNVNQSQETQLRAQMAKETAPPASLPSKPLPPPKPEITGTRAPVATGKASQVGASHTPVPASPAAATAKGTPAHKPETAAVSTQQHAAANPGRTKGANQEHHGSSAPPQNHPAQAEKSRPRTPQPTKPPVSHAPAQAAPASHAAPHPSAAPHGHTPAQPSGHGSGGSHPSQPAGHPAKEEKKKHD